MLDDTKIAKLRELRASGLTPKEIARSLGVRRADVDTLIRTDAAIAARPNESPLVGCWVNRGWSSGLSWEGFPEWTEDADTDTDTDTDTDDGRPRLSTVVIARAHRYDKVSVVTFLVDPQCLGIKNAIPPRTMDRIGLREFVAVCYSMYDQPPIEISIDLRSTSCMAPSIMVGHSGSSRMPTSIGVATTSARGTGRPQSASDTMASPSSSKDRTTTRGRSSERSSGPSAAATSRSYWRDSLPALGHWARHSASNLLVGASSGEARSTRGGSAHRAAAPGPRCTRPPGGDVHRRELAQEVAHEGVVDRIKPELSAKTRRVERDRVNDRTVLREETQEIGAVELRATITADREGARQVLHQLFPEGFTFTPADVPGRKRRSP